MGSTRIDVGDLVVIYEDWQNLHAVRVTVTGIFYGYFGKFPHAALRGKRYGTRLYAGSGMRRFVYLLSPSAELWTAALPHRTQILYIADSSMIALHLALVPGSRCIEAGTGSGSLSHALARTLGTPGHLFTYEFNSERAKLAKAEFEANGVVGHVTCRHGDVCADGWAYSGVGAETVDAAVFDLPQPWDAVRIVAPLIRPGGRLCTFSPCIEQVARTVGVLQECSFTQHEVVEVLVRTHEVRVACAQQNTLANALGSAQALRRAPTLGERELARAASGGAAGPAVLLRATVPGEAQSPGEASTKRARLDRTADAAVGGPTRENATLGAPSLQSRPYADMRGHTGFLLFCTKHVG